MSLHTGTVGPRTAALQSQKEVQGLWLPRSRNPQAALKSEGTYWPVKHMNIMAKADADRHAKAAVFAFPETGAAFIADDPRLLRGIIAKLQGILDNMEAHGQSAVVSMQERFK